MNPFSIEVKVEGDGGSSFTYVSWFTLGIREPHITCIVYIKKPVRDTTGLLLKLKYRDEKGESVFYLFLLVYTRHRRALYDKGFNEFVV